MKKLVFSIATILAIGSSSLQAGGKLVEPPYVPPVSITDGWSGFYTGLAVGYISGKDPMPDKYVSLGSETKPSGFIGGLYTGVNKKFTNDVLMGLELALNYTNIKDTTPWYNTSGEKTGLFSTIKQKNEVALYARVGKVINNKYLPYLLGGVSWTKLESSESRDKSLVGSDSINGWTIGAGFETKISKNWYSRIQYRYSKYSKANIKYHNGGGVVVPAYRTHTIQAGVSYHF